MKTISITGASGFVGQHLLNMFVHHSDCDFRVLIREKTSHNVYKSNRVMLVKGDLTRRESLDAFIEPGCIVVNLAYLSSNNLEQNLIATRNLAEVCIDKKIKRFVHCSTAAVVGRTKGNKITEETKCNPKNNYEITKWEIEKEIQKISKNKFELVVIRPTAIYGPGVKNLLKLSNELVSGNIYLRYLRSSLFNKRKMNLVAIDNVAQAIIYIALTEQKIDREVLIISDDDQSMNNYRDIEKCLSRNLGVKDHYLPIIPFPKLVLSLALKLLRRSNINTLRVYSSEKLKKFGFSSSVKLEEGIASFAKWYKSVCLNGEAGDP